MLWCLQYLLQAHNSQAAVSNPVLQGYTPLEGNPASQEPSAGRGPKPNAAGVAEMGAACSCQPTEQESIRMTSTVLLFAAKVVKPAFPDVSS